MESKLTITADMIAQAQTYIPLMDKRKLIENMTPICISRVKMTDTTSGDSYPDRAGRDDTMTNLCLMGVLIKAYLNQPFEFDVQDMQMPADEYDKWAGSHVMNQLERLKSNKEISAKVYDLLYDFKDFKWAFLRSIDAQVEHLNDVVTRMGQLLSQIGMNVPSAEQVEQIAQQFGLNENPGQAAEEQAVRDA